MYGRAERLIWAVDAADPAARTALAAGKFVAGDQDAFGPRFRPFGVENPADEFIACQRRDVLPGGREGRVGHQRYAQVGR